ncbi:MAG TPA: PAS domain S-box protein [Azospirillum sp.]
MAHGSAHPPGPELDAGQHRPADVEQAAHRAEARLAHLVDNLPVGAVHLEGGVLTLNRAAETITGYRRQELTTLEAWGKALFGDRQAAMRELYEMDRAAGFPAPREVRLRRKDGSERAVEFAAYASERGEIWIMNDVTERRQAELEAKERSRLLRLAEQMAHVGHWRLSLPDGTLTWSEEMFRIRGLDPATHVPTRENTIATYHPDDRAFVARYVETAVRSREPYGYELRIIRADGDLRDVACRSQVEVGPDGAVTAVFGVLQDITDRKRAERELATAMERFRDYANAASDWFWEMGPDLRFSYFSERLTRVTGTLPEEALGKSRTDIAANAEDPDFWRDHLDDLENHRPFRDFVYTHRRTDGETRIFRISGTPVFTAEGVFTGYRGVGTDISEQVRTEEELKRGRVALERQAAELAALARDLDRARQEAEALRAKAEAANEAKSRFLAVMSHELRTPMTGIMGLIDLLLTTPLAAQQADWVRTLRTSAGSLLRLLNDILDFSKIEAGGLRLEEVGFAVQDVMDDVVRLFSVPASEKDILLKRSIPHDVPPGVVGDPTRLRQVLANLVGNALKFTERGRVEMRVATLRRDGAHAVLRFEVQDTGIGMDADTRALLFRPFEQGDASIARRYGGTGLGLAICRRLVTAMGGEIGLTSAPGAGTTVWFTVRFAAAAGPVPQAPLPCAPALAVEPPAPGRRILLAEDNPVSRDLIAAMLERMGHTVTAVPDGADAVAALADGAFDLVLMDMQMPGMDGAEATRRIRALPPPRGLVPVVALTADAASENRPRYMAAGLTDLLTKPVDWDRLRALIPLAILGRSHAAPPPAAPPEPVDGDEVAAIDRPRLLAIAASLGDKDLDVLLDSVRAELTRQLDLARAAAGRGDTAGMRRAVHALRGMAGNFGLTAVERGARRTDADGPSHLDHLDRAVADTLRALDGWRR